MWLCDVLATQETKRHNIEWLRGYTKPVLGNNGRPQAAVPAPGTKPGWHEVQALRNATGAMSGLWKPILLGVKLGLGQVMGLMLGLGLELELGLR